jgi:hypothetical protein
MNVKKANIDKKRNKTKNRGAKKRRNRTSVVGIYRMKYGYKQKKH